MEQARGVDVRLAGIVKRFGEIEAVCGVSLDIRRGEFFTLLGPSGSGKSTLLHIIGGVEAPPNGRVFFQGEDVTDLPANRRRSSTVFQSLALFPHMNVGLNVEYGLKIRNEAKSQRRRKAEAMLDVVGLGGFYNRDVNKLSGGQRQRVALARALVIEPSVLLLDEPLAALDERLRQQMQYELKQLHQRLGTTFVSVTHNQQEALTMSSRVGVLRDGRLEQVGTPEKLYEAPRNAFVADFIGAANLLRGRQDPADPAIVEVSGYRFRCRSNARRAPASRGDVLLAVRPERITVGASAEARDNRCSLRLRDVTYKGGVLEYAMLLPDDQEVRAHVVPDHASQRLPVGAQLEVGWSAQDTLVLESDEVTACDPELAS